MPFLGDEPLGWQMVGYLGNLYWEETANKLLESYCSELILERHYMWNIGELLPGQLIGDALQVNYWRTIANELIGEALQVNYWRAIASQPLERHCNWDIAKFWQVNYWRSTAGNPLRDCNVSIGQIFHFTCIKDTVGQHWGIYCCSNAVQLCNGSW